MKILSIEAQKEKIVFHLEGADAPTTLLVREQIPVKGPVSGRQLYLGEGNVCGGTLTLPRYEGKHDRLFSRFTLWQGKKMLEGPQYVTDFSEDAHLLNEPYMQTPSKKGTPARGEDARALGVCHATLNINLLDVLNYKPGEDTMPYEFDGETYYVNRKSVEGFDRIMQEYWADRTNVYIIVLNAPRLFNGPDDPLFNSLVLHPGYDPEGFISAFNVQEEDGLRYYMAFMDFLASRYMRADRKYGHTTGFIVGNEVTLPWDWGNMGHGVSADQYMNEYTAALRIAWQTAQKYLSCGRAYISMADNFNGFSGETTYNGSEVLSLVNHYSQKEGNFGWNVAYHPYCESFQHPDFWNDRNAVFEFNTRLITFKNIEVLPAYLAQEKFLYKGQPRRIIFSEQGFNTMDAYTEEIGYAAYCLAYLKIQKQETIECFMYHAYSDNKYEFGLNLGIRRAPEEDGTLGEAKPVWYAFRDMGTEKEEAAIEKAKAIVGEHMWNITLNPPEIKGWTVDAKAREFGEQADPEKIGNAAAISG